MQRRIAVAGTLALAGALGLAGVASAAQFTFTQQAVSTIVSVSPDVLFVPQSGSSGTFYLFTTGAGIGVYSSPDGISWSPVPGAATPRGPYADPSVITMPDGTYRMYLAERTSGTQPCSGKQLRYATSVDLVTWNLQPGVLLDDLGCGVPDVVRDGAAYYLYYVRGGPGFAHGIYLATSADGLSWTPNPTIRTPQDRVDPSVVKVADGKWLMMTSDMPSGAEPGPFFQKLYVATSSDGITWDFGADQPVFAPDGVSAFDPNLNAMPDGTLKAWFARGSSAASSVVALGTLAADSPTPLAPPARPVVTFAGSRVTVTWTYPTGAGMPDAFRVEVKQGANWSTVQQVDGSATSISSRRTAVGAKIGAKLSIRVVALRGAEIAVSPVRTVKVPR